MRKNTRVVRTDPELWDACKDEVLYKTGMFCARAMQQAVALYKKRGGGYLGEKSLENPLTQWERKILNIPHEMRRV